MVKESAWPLISFFILYKVKFQSFALINYHTYRYLISFIHNAWSKIIVIHSD
jgi:hypothetical protein